MTLPIPASVRRAPAQKRSQDRMTALLDATAQLVDRYGVHGVSTGAVARASHSSVGVVYRYFPNIASLFDALTVRNVRVFGDRLETAIGPVQCTWNDAARAVVDALAALLQHQPGFRVLGLGDSHHEGARRDLLNRAFLARTIAGHLQEQYRGLPEHELLLQVDSAIEVAYALLRRAYAEEGEPRERLRQVAFEVVQGMAPRMPAQ